MADLKVGDRVKIISDADVHHEVGDIGRIESKSDGIYDFNVRVDGKLGVYDADELELVGASTLADADSGDILVHGSGKIRTVLSRAEIDGKVYLWSVEADSAPCTYTVSSLTSLGWDIKGSETEVTLQQVAEKFGVDVKDLRIKE